MADIINNIPDEEAEDITVELELEDGKIVNCAIITILEVDGKDYIALLPMVDEDDENYFYDDTPTKTIKKSTTDPDSGFMHRDGKPKGFFHFIRFRHMDVQQCAAVFCNTDFCPATT